MHVFKPWFPGHPSRRAWARAGGFLFFGLFLGAGTLCLYQMAIRPTVRWLGARNWQPASATIESSRLSSAAAEGGRVYSIDVNYSWSRSGQTFQGTRYGLDDGKTNIAVERMRAEVDRLTPGKTVECWVNPQNPVESVLVRDLPFFTLMGLFFPLPFLTVGVIGIGWSLFGPALVRRVRRRQLETVRRLGGNGLPAWLATGTDESALDSESVRLIFARSERAAETVGILAVTVFWNGIVAVFALVAIAEAWDGNHGKALGLTLFLLPFIAIGSGMAWIAWISWRNFLRPNWVALIQPVPGPVPVESQISFAATLAFRGTSLDFARLRLVAMAAPWDSESNRPQRSPFSLFRKAGRRPRPPATGKPPSKEHELISLELPLPRPGSADTVTVPAIPEITSASKNRWGRWWMLEIEHRDGRLETFDLSTE